MSATAFVLALASSTLTATAAMDRELDRLIEGRGELPSLREVQAAAQAELGLSEDEDAASWGRRARLRGVVPRVDAAFGSDADLDIRASATSPAQTTTEGRQLGFDVAVRFELGNLLFSELELRANREAIARAAAIQLARDRATELYFERLSVELELREAPSAALLLSARRLDGLIDVMTGGRVSRRARKDDAR